MEDDFIAAITQEVKEDLIQEYLHERRLMEEQIRHVKGLTEETRELQDQLYKRFARIYELLVESRFVMEFTRLLGLSEPPFFQKFGEHTSFRKGLGFIKALGLTGRGRFRRLVAESYRRLLSWNDQYEDSYQNLRRQTDAVNYNLEKFKRNYDLLTIINFLKDMDVETLQRKHFLGDNFTPEEMASVEKSLQFKSISIRQENLILPVALPPYGAISSELRALADQVYSACREKLKVLVR
jgi:hypothetical protein